VYEVVQNHRECRRRTSSRPTDCANALALLVRLRNLWVGRKYVCDIRDGFELPHTLHNYDVLLGWFNLHRLRTRKCAGRTLEVFVGLVCKVWSASRAIGGVGERGSASRKKILGTRLRSRRVYFGRLLGHFTRSHVLPRSRLNADTLWRRCRETLKLSDFWSFLTDLPSSRGRGLAQDGRTASQMHQAAETN